jgi:hypothetical protein
MNDLSSYLPNGDDVALIVRTDFSDDAAWEAIRVAVITGTENSGDLGPPQDSVLPNWFVLVDDRAWENGSEPDLRAALAGAPDQDFFVADATAMREERHPLMAFASVSTLEDEDEDDQEPFRCFPEWVYIIHANLSEANMDFSEYAAMARSSETQVYDVVDG